MKKVLTGVVALALFAAGCGGSSESEELAQVRADGGRQVVPQCSFVARYVAQHPDLADLLALHLRDAGHAVETVADGALALQRALADPVDLVVLDPARIADRARYAEPLVPPAEKAH